MDLPPELQKKIHEISGMGSFEKELQRFLESYDLPPIAQNVDGWSHFFYLYTQVIQDIPLMVKSSSRSLSGIRSLQPRINNLQTRDGS